MYILFDVSRLIQRKGLSAPTGIDRVDYAYGSCPTAWCNFAG
jgi:hypothetical protein